MWYTCDVIFKEVSQILKQHWDLFEVLYPEGSSTGSPWCFFLKNIFFIHLNCSFVLVKLQLYSRNLRFPFFSRALILLLYRLLSRVCQKKQFDSFCPQPQRHIPYLLNPHLSYCSLTLILLAWNVWHTRSRNRAHTHTQKGFLIISLKDGFWKVCKKRSVNLKVAGSWRPGVLCLHPTAATATLYERWLPDSCYLSRGENTRWTDT